MRWLAAVVVLGGCSLAPRMDECVTVVPGVEFGDVRAAVVADWSLALGGVTYDRPRWVDQYGIVVGWSREEGAPVCVLEWPFTAEGRQGAVQP